MKGKLSATEDKRNIRIIALGIIAMGLLLGVKAGFMTTDRILLLVKGVRVNGEVVRIEERPSSTYRGRKSTAYFPVVAYRVLGTNTEVLLRSETATDHDALQVGYPVQVLYSLDAPDKGMIVDLWLMWAKNLLLWVISFMITGMGFGLWWFFVRPDNDRPLEDVPNTKMPVQFSPKRRK